MKNLQYFYADTCGALATEIQDFLQYVGIKEFSVQIVNDNQADGNTNDDFWNFYAFMTYEEPVIIPQQSTPVPECQN